MAVAFSEPERHRSAPHRSVRLRVIGGSVELRDDVPKTRAECPKRRPCGHVRCEWHLWLVQGVDRPGRRGANWRALSSELRPVMMEWPLPPSCGADVIEAAVREGWSVPKMARSIGVRLSGFRYLLTKAIRKLRASGVSLREFLDGRADPRGTLEPEEQ